MDKDPNSLFDEEKGIQLKAVSEFRSVWEFFIPHLQHHQVVVVSLNLEKVCQGHHSGLKIGIVDWWGNEHGHFKSFRRDSKTSATANLSRIPV